MNSSKRNQNDYADLESSEQGDQGQFVNPSSNRRDLTIAMISSILGVFLTSFGLVLAVILMMHDW